MNTNICPHCQQPTLRQVGPTTIDCINAACKAYTVTLTAEQFMALTPAQLESYQRGQTNIRSLDDEQAAFEARVKSIKEAAEKRAAARARGEQIYG